MTKPSIGNDKDLKTMWDSIKAATYEKNEVTVPASTTQSLDRSYMSGKHATDKSRIELLEAIKRETYKRHGIHDEKYNQAPRLFDETHEENE